MGKRDRSNQKQRTRKDLLAAAARLMKNGRMPTVAEVAEEAGISRATAYRYFPTPDLLLAEAPVDGAVPVPEKIFSGDASTDPLRRLERAERALHDMCYANESQLRVMLARSLDLKARQAGGRIPVRQNRRVPLIEAALAPVRSRLDDAAYDRLVAALAHFFGTESMIVFRDVLRMRPRRAREVKSWAIRALVREAIRESSG